MTSSDDKYTMKNILVVDDEIDLAETLASYLEYLGYKTSYCESVDLALQKVATERFDLIISDMKMPAKDGLFFYNLIKDKIKKEKTAFVFMTGNSEKLSMSKAYEIGVDEFIAKPFNLDDLKVVVNFLLKAGASEEQDGKKFYRIAIKDFLLANTNKYDIYLKIDESLQCLVRKGNEFLPERLAKYQKNGSEYIYLTASDFLIYVNLQFKMADTLKVSLETILSRP